jgi:hypothetical protein
MSSDNLAHNEKRLSFQAAAPSAKVVFIILNIMAGREEKLLTDQH